MSENKEEMKGKMQDAIDRASKVFEEIFPDRDPDDIHDSIETVCDQIFSNAGRKRKPLSEESLEESIYGHSRLLR